MILRIKLDLQNKWIILQKYSYDVVGTNLEYMNSHEEIIDTKTFPENNRIIRKII